MDWQRKYAAKETTAAQAIAKIPRGKHIFISSGAAEPTTLVHELVAQAPRFAGNQIVHLMTLGPAPYVEPKYADNFRHNAFFIGTNVRKAVHEGRADYTPVFLSQIPQLMRSRRMPVDVALINVSPPDPFGFVNLGISVDVVSAAIEAAQLVIAQINPRMPSVFGHGFLPMERIDAWVAVDEPIAEHPPEPLDEIALEIGRNVAALVGNGATLQMGIGQIPDAVLKALTSKKDLGIWTEMFSDGVIDLIENGNITGRHKTIHPNKVSASFTFGTRRLYDFIDRNPIFTFHPSDYINNPINIAQQHRMVAINSALQIDLTGQVCADSIGTKFYSGIGGQVDFIRGASMCPAGKPIIAIRSTAKNNTISRIAPLLSEGAGVVTSRGDVRFVVTEYGTADLQGKSIRERAMALIAIAHPDFRGELLEAAKQRRYVFTDHAQPAAAYPRELERVIETDKGTVLLRPVQITDEEKLGDFFYNLSETTVHQRWMQLIKSMPREQLLDYLDVDYADRMTVVVETMPEATEPELIGVARYHKDRATNQAEVAFVIHDAWQGQGLGTALLKMMIELARQRGILAFTALVLADNHAMIRVFHRSGLQVQSTLRGNVYHLTMPLAQNGPLRRTPTGPLPAV